MTRIGARVRAAGLRARALTQRPVVARTERWADRDFTGTHVRAAQARAFVAHSASAAWRRDPARFADGIVNAANIGRADRDPGSCCARCGRDMTDRRVCSGCGSTEAGLAVWACTHCSWEGPSGWMTTGLGSLHCPHCATRGSLYPAARTPNGQLIPVTHHMW